MTYAPRVPSTTTARRTGRTVALVALAVGAAAGAAVLIAAGLPWSRPAPPTAVVAAGETPVLAPAPLTIGDGARVLIFGDSWTYGSAASDPMLGYAYVLGETRGWETIVDGVRGSGYLRPGLDGGSFGERIAALDPALDPDLVIVQGSINDRKLPAAGYRDAVASAWDDLAAVYPDAAIVVLGPAPQVLPVEKATARIDADLSELASGRGWWYISPLAEEWITPENYAAIIDTGDIGRDHPSTPGHAYLAERLGDALDRLAAPTDVVADAPAEPAN